MTIIESILMKKASQLSSRARVLRLPKPNKPRFPLEIERKYYAEMKKLIVDKLEEITRRYLLPALPNILSEAKQDMPTFDAEGIRRDNYGRLIDMIFGQMKVAFARELTDQEIDELTRKYASQGQTFNKATLGATFQKVLGVDPLISEPYLQPIMREFIDTNTNLIRSIGSQYFDQVQADTYRHIQVGVYNKVYATKIKSEYEQEFKNQFEAGILKRRVTNADARARLIARDQISKYNGQLNQTRQTALGITKYRWVTAGDERVRERHRQLNGRIFDWNNPPISDSGEPINPGDDFQCRCNALPIFDEGVTENENLLRLLNS